MDVLSLLSEFVATPGPPGQEERIRKVVESHLAKLGIDSRVDAKGNLIVGAENPRVVVTAHLDEIALIVRNVFPDGRLGVDSLGGLHPFKLGEGPVSILATSGDLDGVLSFGGVHIHAENPVREAEEDFEWDNARVFTGCDWDELLAAGVRPGTRVCVHPSRRNLFRVHEHMAGYFLDDRADLVSWIVALKDLKRSLDEVAFVATVSEETGGEGALYYLNQARPEVCIALELGPNVEDAPVEIDDQPTVWAHDSYSTMTPADGDLVAQVGQELGFELQWQSLSRGGSDASCAASHGHCARPITLGLPMENSHGFEIIHPNAMLNLARLTAELVRRL